MKERAQFCVECGKEMPYHMRNITITRKIRKKEYSFEIAAAFCVGCGKTVSPPGLFDSNAEEIDRQYREEEGIVCAENIKALMERYCLEEVSLSLALGFDETTLTGYLAGQIPSAEASKILKMAFQSPDYMMQKLQKNRAGTGEAAYRKAMCAGEELKRLFSLSAKMRSVIFYLLKKARRVTPLSLQKMLYFVQGIHMAFYGVELFQEDCQAWAHGPVYKEVYETFRGFRFEPIEERRFCSSFICRNGFEELSDREKKVVALVAESLGVYSGKALERVTHGETPWKEARNGCRLGQRSAAVISKESVRTYFLTVASQYDFTSVVGLREYIDSRLSENGQADEKMSLKI